MCFGCRTSNITNTTHVKFTNLTTTLDLLFPVEPTGPAERRVVSDAMVVVVNNRREQESNSEEEEEETDTKAASTQSAGPAESASVPAVVSTICEYLRELGLRGENLAVPTPVCNEEGRYSARQCDTEGCFCVDDFGVEIRNSRISASSGNNSNGNSTTGGAGSEAECRQIRSAKPCYNVLCRLGCDYGFEYDAEGCPLCACRNPCKNARCTPDHICQLAEPDAPCNHRWCPPVPKCTFLIFCYFIHCRDGIFCITAKPFFTRYVYLMKHAYMN